MVNAIKQSGLNAIELGCDLITKNKHIPCGHTFKFQILHLLKNQQQHINSAYREKLAKKDVKPLCKLIKRFNPKYAQYRIENVQRQTEITSR